MATYKEQMDAWSKRRNQIVKMHDVDGLKFTEIAAQLGMSSGAVSSAYNRGVRIQAHKLELDKIVQRSYAAMATPEYIALNNERVKLNEQKKQIKERLNEIEHRIFQITSGYDNDDPIEVLDLHVRVFNALKRAGITHVSEVLALINRPYESIPKITNFGEGSFELLKHALKEKGYL